MFEIKRPIQFGAGDPGPIGVISSVKQVLRRKLFGGHCFQFIFDPCL